jgi:hypothetical protein
MKQEPVEAAVPLGFPVAAKPRRKPFTAKTLGDIELAKIKRLENEYGRTAELRERAFSSKSLHPCAASAHTIRAVMAEHYGHIPDLTLEALADDLETQCNRVSQGNLERPEAMLMSQAQTLDAVFQHLTQRAYDNLRDIDSAERVLRLALRAQNQCRATLETLGYLKNPTAVFAKQANVSAGPQQVNNHGASPAREIDSGQNKLLEQRHGKRLDSRAASNAGSRDSEMAAVAKINGSKDRRR